MQTLILFFANAVYQAKKRSRPYKPWLHKAIYIGIALLPILSAISFYGLSLRVEQYGWSLSRCWAFLVWFLLALFSIGYCWNIIKRKDNWLEALSVTNIRIGWIVITLLLAVNAPILDFRKISADSQIDRLENDKVSYDDFDYRYFRYSLAKPGYDALQELKVSITDTHPYIAIKIDSFYVKSETDDSDDVIKRLINNIQGINTIVPKSLSDAIFTKYRDRAWNIRHIKGLQLLEVDLNQDGKNDYILLEERENHISLILYHERNEVWMTKNLVFTGKQKNSAIKEALLQSLDKKEYDVASPKWSNLKIGEIEFQVQ